MQIIFEKSKTGRGTKYIPDCDVSKVSLPENLLRQTKLHLPEIAETDLSRHFTQLIERTHGMNNGFYPLGSCTMKYNPKINELCANLPGFTEIHPLQPEHTIQGCLEVLNLSEKLLTEITGMDAMTFQPAAGAHGEFTGVLLIKAYHDSRGDNAKRRKIIVPDSAHGTNPATAAMFGYTVVNVPSNADGCVDIEKLKAVVGEDTAGLMLTNPNTVGLFDKNILEITKIIHDAGGLCYYDGANLNAVMGMARPGDMGFDCVHLNLHKTFSTPHGGGGPGAGAVGCKNFLKEFLPNAQTQKADDTLSWKTPKHSAGNVKAFYGNFLVVVRALTYILTLGAEGIREASQNAVLNANYLMKRMKERYAVAFDCPCMHEFVLTLEKLKSETGVSALDIAKGMLDNKMHPPTMYFPLIVHEALMFEPTETESKEVLDNAADVLIELYDKAKSNAEALHNSPMFTPIRRLDEVGAARNPILKFQF